MDKKLEKKMGREKKRMGRMNGRKVDELIRARLAFLTFFILLLFFLFLVWFFIFVACWPFMFECFFVDWFVLLV